MSSAVIQRTLGLPKERRGVKRNKRGNANLEDAMKYVFKMLGNFIWNFRRTS
jgi:hypothetical protein